MHLASLAKAALEQAKAELTGRFNVSVEIHPVDLSDGDAARDLMKTCRDVDILVNNAGEIPGGDIQAIGEARWREAWDLKVFGYINTCRAALENMRARGKGVIVNIIGAAGERPSFGYIAGSGGNAAIMAMTRAMGAASSADGIRVVGINPGMIETDRLVTLARTTAEKQFGDAVAVESWLQKRQARRWMMALPA